MQTQILVITGNLSYHHPTRVYTDEGWQMSRNAKECLKMILNVPLCDEGRTQHLTNKVYCKKFYVLRWQYMVYSVSSDILSIRMPCNFLIKEDKQTLATILPTVSSMIGLSVFIGCQDIAPTGYCTAMFVQNKKGDRKDAICSHYD